MMAAEMEEERGLLLSLFDGSCVARVASSTTVNVKLDESISFCCFVYSDGSSSSQIIYYARNNMVSSAIVLRRRRGGHFPKIFVWLQNFFRQVTRQEWVNNWDIM